MADKVFKNDTAIIEANIYDENGVDPLQASTVSWTIRKPDGTDILGGPQAVAETIANILVNDTDLPGLYATQVTFTLSDGSRKSTVVNFEVNDPLELHTSSLASGEDAAIDRAWMKLEDLFDSEFGGPHLRDRTMNQFSRDKIARFIPDALYGINNTYQPATNFDETNFPYDAHTPLLSQALLVESIYQLIRSYAEQPNPVGGNVTFFDRRDYLNRWQTILQLELTKLMGWLDLFKRDQLGYATSSTLVGGYASGYATPPRYMRGRYPTVAYRW